MELKARISFLKAKKKTQTFNTYSVDKQIHANIVNIKL